MNTSANTDISTNPSRVAPRLVAVVVTYNRLAKLRATIARLLETPAKDLAAILVVNNASDDGTGAWLDAQDDPRLVVHHGATNRGGAGGFETGMRLAVSRWDPDWIVVMDDDARPGPGALTTFLAGDRSNYEVYAAAVRHPNGRICDINRPSINPFWNRAAFLRTAFGGGRDGFHLSPEDYEVPGLRAVDAASFVGLFVSRAAIERVGYPDGRLFVYGDDVLYTLRLSAAGGRIAFDPGLRFEHDFSTITAGERRFRPLWKSYYHHRNLLMVYREAAGWLFWPALLVVLPKWVLKVRHYSGQRGVFLQLLGRSVWDGLIGRTGVDHAQVLVLAGRETGPIGSEYPGDNGPAE
jgi:GT2 family glycosyltransferase